MGVGVGRVRRLIQDRSLFAARDGKALVIPEEIIVDGAPMAHLRGTLILLADSGFSEDEALTWLYADNDELGQTPMAAMLSGQRAQVRRAVQSLAF